MMERKKLDARNLLAAMLFALLTAAVLYPVSASAASISPKKATLYAGEKKTLKLSGAKGKITWKSSKKSVAAVNSSGVVTAKKTGKCTITAKKSGKSYKCSITVKKLPKNYALLNGTRIKVGKTATITYTVQSKKAIASMRLWYYYDREAVQVENVEDSKRFASFDWIDNMSWPEVEKGGKIYESYQLWGYDKKNPGYDPIPIDCQKAKVFDKIKVKVSKTGKYSFESDFEFYDSESKKIKKGDVMVTEKIEQ